MSSKIKIYHNPACGTSRNTLTLIRNTGEEPVIIEYLKTPLTEKELTELIQNSGLTVREALRQNVEPYKNLKLEQNYWTDSEIIAFMLEYPILINRPFVTTHIGTKLCRPSEIVLDILPLPQLKPFTKEDGEMIIDENLNRIK